MRKKHNWSYNFAITHYAQVLCMVLVLASSYCLLVYVALL